MTKKSLQAWYSNGDITYSQKEIISKFGVGDCYPECERKDFLKIYYWNDILKRHIGYSEDSVYQINFFSTWWNNNLILFIDGEENSYMVKLIVYEMPYKKNGEIKMEEIFEVFYVGWICPGDLYKAKGEAKRIEEKLRGNNPILCEGLPKTINVYYNDDYNARNFPITYGVFGGEEVKVIELRGSDFYTAKNNPDDYFKPLDIVKIFIHSRYDSNKEGTRHTGIYLGNRQVCHLFVVNRATKKFEIMSESWEKFLGIIPSANKMIRYHPVIPFKHKDKIVEHIAKSITSVNVYYPPESKTSSASFDHDSKYNLYNNNCEHPVNKCVLGLNFSEYAEKLTESYTKELDISKKIDETNKEFARKFNYKGNISEIKGYGQRAFNVNLDGINTYEACIEVQPKTKNIFKEIYQSRYTN